MQTLVSLVGVPIHDSRVGSKRAHAAVLGRDVEDVARCRVAAGARHVLRHHVGMARQMLADVAAERASPQVVAAARPEADDHLHALAGKRVGLRRRRRRARADQRGNERRREQHGLPEHPAFPRAISSCVHIL